MENCLLPKLIEYQLHPILTEVAKTKSREEPPTPLPPVQSAAFNSSNLRTNTMFILLSGTPPAEEYLFMMTKLGSRGFLVQLDRLQISTLVFISTPHDRHDSEMIYSIYFQYQSFIVTVI